MLYEITGRVTFSNSTSHHRIAKITHEIILVITP